MINMKRFFVLAMTAASIQFSQVAHSEVFTPEQCQAKYEALVSYTDMVRATIIYYYKAYPRYAIAKRRVLEKQIFDANLRFSTDCPDFVK